VNVEAVGAPGGRNYGWSTFEGNLPTGWSLPILPPVDSPALVPPIFDHPHSLTNWGGSIVGGYVYRGGRMPELAGQYVFGDYVSGFLWSLKRGRPTLRPTHLNRSD